MLVAARAWRGLCVWQLFGKLVVESERSPDGRSGPWMLLGVPSLAAAHWCADGSLRRARQEAAVSRLALLRAGSVPDSRHTMTALIVPTHSILTQENPRAVRPNGGSIETRRVPRGHAEMNHQPHIGLYRRSGTAVRQAIGAIATRDRDSRSALTIGLFKTQFSRAPFPIRLNHSISWATHAPTPTALPASCSQSATPQ